MNLDISIDPPSVVTPTMIVINVIEARAEGPRIKASAIAPSGDWARIQDNGNWKIDARLAFKTDDDEAFFCYYSGVILMTESLNQRIAAGENIPGSDMYLRAAPNFETASEKYAWLNDILTVGKVKSFGGGKVSYDIFEIL